MPPEQVLLAVMPQGSEERAFAYLRDGLIRIAATPISQLDQLLPDRWQAPQPAPATTDLIPPSTTLRNQRAANTFTANAVGRTVTISQLHQFLPDRWQAAHQSTTVTD